MELGHKAAFSWCLVTLFACLDQFLGFPVAHGDTMDQVDVGVKWDKQVFVSAVRRDRKMAGLVGANHALQLFKPGEILWRGRACHNSPASSQASCVCLGEYFGTLEACVRIINEGLTHWINGTLGGAADALSDKGLVSHDCCFTFGQALCHP